MWIRRFTWPVQLLAVLVAACGAERGRESPDVEAVAVAPDLTVGLVEGDSAYLFGAVTSVATDTLGRIYVADRLGATVRAYDDAGRFLATIARGGSGPGEVSGWPADLAVAPSGELYMRDGSRITVFAPREEGGTADSVAVVWRVAGYGNLTTARGRVGVSGEYYYPGGQFRPGEPPRYFYVPFFNGVLRNDTLEVPAYPGLSNLRPTVYRLGPSDALMLTGLSHVPFAALPAWDVTGNGTIVSSDGLSYVLIESNADGDTVRVIRGPESTLREVPAAEREDSTRALRARLDSLRVPIGELIGLGEGVREQALPAHLPPLIGIHVAPDQSIWVEQWPPEGRDHHRFYDVFRPDGEYAGRSVLLAPLRRDPPPFFGLKHIVGIVTDSLTGVDRVVRFKRPRPTDGSTSQ